MRFFRLIYLSYKYIYNLSNKANKEEQLILII